MRTEEKATVLVMSMSFADVSDVLPKTWEAQVKDLALERATHVERKGGGPGSLDESGLEYWVVSGDVILAELDWLWEFYETWGLNFTRAGHARNDLECAPDTSSAVNINMVTGVGGSYEWHVDPSPYTSILFANLVPESGELSFRPREDTTIRIQPSPGMFYTGFSGMPHAVEQLRGRYTQRFSIPMLYVDSSYSRPEGLDDHIYQGATS